jgi:hypothetical protein
VGLVKRAAAAAACVAVAVGLWSAPGTAARKPRVTFIGDSVSASINYVPQARRYLQHRFDIRFDLAVCRRLVAASCFYQGVQPPTALQEVYARRGSLGRIAVIDVGYNESASTYRAALDRVMRALVGSGVREVVWVTLRATTGNYALINQVIRRAAHRWRQLHVADWNAWSHGEPWFGSDGLHLNAAGALGLARLVGKTIAA